MKTKILTVLICLAIGTTLTGCGAQPTETQPKIPETETVETVTPPAESMTKPPLTPEDEEQPQTSTTPEVTKKDILLRGTASSLNVRKGAGTSYAVVGTLDKGDMVMPISKADGWYEIGYLGGSAYISASYVEEVTFEKANDKIRRQKLRLLVAHAIHIQNRRKRKSCHDLARTKPSRQRNNKATNPPRRPTVLYQCISV